MRTLLVAYAVVWVVIFGYLSVQYLRITRIENEINNLKEALEKKRRKG